MPDRKIIFAVNLPLQIFRATVANADTDKSHISANIIWYVFGQHAGEIWTKSYGPKFFDLQIFDLFEKKKNVF